jgi:hypothetical protein
MVVDRYAAYNYWVPDLPGPGPYPAFGTSPTNPKSLIINGGYLIRSVSIQKDALAIKADFNQTTELEVIGTPKIVTKILLNDQETEYQTNNLGNFVISPAIPYVRLAVPELSKLDWKYVDSLPELQPGYDDSDWLVADKKTTNNTNWPLMTPESLYASDYGYHTGSLIYRGQFTARGNETSLLISTQGGLAFGSSVWLNGTFVGSFKGFDAAMAHNDTYTLPALIAGQLYVFTVVIDHMGLAENWVPGVDEMKGPRGILNYALSNGAPVSWRLTGNLGGEDYQDQFRGPLNEGGFFFERQGYHLPSPPVQKFSSGSPFDGLDAPGVRFYSAPLKLNYNSDRWDIPISFTFTNSTGTGSGAFRAVLYVNGFQFGKYVSNIGPQDDFPVPEGILNYRGENWIGVAIWALEIKGAKLGEFYLTVKTPITTGREKVQVVNGPAWSPRKGAY